MADLPLTTDARRDRPPSGARLVGGRSLSLKTGAGYLILIALAI